MEVKSETEGLQASPPTKPKPIPLSEHLRSQRAWDIERLNRTFIRKRSGKPFDFLTSGTSNKRPQEFLDIIRKPIFSTLCVVDVRNNPNSQHTPQWNKKNISSFLGQNSVDYLHRPDLGVPSEIRRALYAGKLSYTEFFSWYDKNVLAKSRIDELEALVKEKSVVFLCTEVGPTYCHRHRIAEALERDRGYISFDV